MFYSIFYEECLFSFSHFSDVGFLSPLFQEELLVFILPLLGGVRGGITGSVFIYASGILPHLASPIRGGINEFLLNDFKDLP